MADETNQDGARTTSRKVREGIVISTKMDKTVVVAVVDRVRHRRYGKTLQKTNHLYAHDEANDANEGDRVRVAETRPLSKEKRWRIVETMTHGNVADIAPREIGVPAEPEAPAAAAAPAAVAVAEPVAETPAEEPVAEAEEAAPEAEAEGEEESK